MKPNYVLLFCIYMLNLILAFIGEVSIPNVCGWLCAIFMLLKANSLDHE